MILFVHFSKNLKLKRFEINKLTEENKNYESEIDALIYAISHDLKAPIRGIEGFNDILKEDYSKQLDEEGKLFLNKMSLGIEKLKKMIDGLLSLSRINKINFNERSEIQIKNFINELCLEQKYPQIIKVDCDIKLKTNTNAIKILFKELIDNSIKFSKGTKTQEIKIYGQKNNNVYKIFVEDSGVGLDMQYASKMFIPLQKFHREEYPGIGIGLATCKKITKKLQGDILFESSANKGAKITITLPE